MSTPQEHLAPNSTEARSAVISFRLDPEAKRALEERAEMFELSPYALARQYVLEGLSAGDDRQHLQETVSALEDKIAELREEFAHALQVLLASAEMPLGATQKTDTSPTSPSPTMTPEANGQTSLNL